MPGIKRKIHQPLLVMLIALAAGCTQPDTSPIVEIESGQLRGAVVEDVAVFKGIPFAAPPVGEWRWRPPQSVPAWTGVRSAENYGPFCAQPQSALLWFELDVISEDCLSLNVWTPALDEDKRLAGHDLDSRRRIFARYGKYPAFEQSEAGTKEGVVLVTINYRLAFFGFMVHPALKASHP